MVFALVLTASFTGVGICATGFGGDTIGCGTVGGAAGGGVYAIAGAAPVVCAAGY